MMMMDTIIDALNRNVEKALKVKEDVEEDFIILKDHDDGREQLKRKEGSEWNLKRWRDAGYLFYDYLWNKVLDRREEVVRKNFGDDNRFVIPDEKFELRSDVKSGNVSNVISTTDNKDNLCKASNSDDITLQDNKEVLEKYGLSTQRRKKKSSATKSATATIHDYRLNYTQNNVNPIDFNSGDLELFNSLKHLLSHQSIQKEEIIRNELQTILNENNNFVEELLEKYHAMTTKITLDEFVEKVMERLYKQGMERRRKQISSMALLQRHTLSTNLDMPVKPYNPNTTRSVQDAHWSYQIQRKHEFSKQVMNLFNNKADRKLFQDNPMGFHWLDPSIDVYHPLELEHVVFDPYEYGSKEKTKKETKKQDKKSEKKETPLPLIPKRKKREKGALLNPYSLF